MNRILREILIAAQRVPAMIDSIFDRLYLDEQVPLADAGKWRSALIAACNKPRARILEVGSREVTGQSTARQEFWLAQYVGFDLYPGPNVDVVGDAHKLSSYFEGEPRFDAVISGACFEHFAMPWVVSTEIAKVLHVGGYVLIETHFSYGSHERPWHFFQFSDMALRVLFPAAMGFECVGAGASDPMVGRFSRLAQPRLRYRPIAGLYSGSAFFGRKVRDVLDFAWDRAEMTELVGGTLYPQPVAAIQTALDKKDVCEASASCGVGSGSVP
jgi:hypothetical protein